MPGADPTAPSPPAELISFRRAHHVPGVELLEARATDRLYTMFHERYAISLNLGPSGAAHYRRRTHEHPTDVLFLAEPGELHRCVRADGPLDFIVVFVEPAVMRDVAGTDGSDAPLHWRRVMSDPDDPCALALRALTRCHARDGVLAAETAVTEVLSALLRSFSEASPRHRSPAARPNVLRARELLCDLVAHDVPLAAIAREVGLSREHLLRAFRAEFGTTPHSYVMQVRVARARAMLAAGSSAGAAAVACGFCDQSHMNRWFGKTFGVTPGRYARWVNDR